jgi:ABC-type uncharacterized transport system permease subunit
VLELLEALLSSTLDYAPALVFAALGAALSERAGVVSLHVEGMMRTGAFVAAVAALHLPTPAAIGVGMLGAAAVAGVHALFALKLRADQVISGMALNLLALSLFSFLLEALYLPTGTPDIAQLERHVFDVLQGISLLRALNGHTHLTWLALVLPLAVSLVLHRTALGLRIRAVGEAPGAVATLGVSVARLRTGCVVVGGLLAGLGGAALSTTTLNRFEQHMPAGLGYMALAAMVFGRWTPLGAFGAAVFFAAGNALRVGLASSAPALMQVVPQGVLMALPYALTLVVLAFQGGRAQAPVALGIPYDPERR